jgi:hypothetical protein
MVAGIIRFLLDHKFKSALPSDTNTLPASCVLRNQSKRAFRGWLFVELVRASIVTAEWT